MTDSETCHVCGTVEFVRVVFDVPQEGVQTSCANHVFFGKVGLTNVAIQTAFFGSHSPLTNTA